MEEITVDQDMLARLLTPGTNVHCPDQELLPENLLPTSEDNQNPQWPCSAIGIDTQESHQELITHYDTLALH